MFTFYTGLKSYSLFLTIFNLCLPSMMALRGDGACRKPALSLKKQLCLTLMRLRLNLTQQDLAYRFQISVSTVSRYIHKWIDVMYVRLSKNFIVWPDRGVLKDSIPFSFRKNFPNCIVIIDCFEVFIDMHADLLDRASTYSSYKHHNTIKFLIGISPTGAIIFLSQAYGGHETDPDIVHDSKFLHNILPGDQILADRGFLI